jgi:hypothetical protein
MVTHEAEMAAYAKRIVRFVDGRVASDQTQEAVRAERAAAPEPVRIPSGDRTAYSPVEGRTS